MVKSTRISEPTSTTTFSRSSLLNPGSSARTVYVRGIRLGAFYSPASSVVRVRARPLSLSIMLTVAPGMTAPVESLTLPRIRPKLPCADSAKEKSNTTAVVLNRHEVILRFDVTDVISPSYPNTAHDRERQHLSKIYPHRIKFKSASALRTQNSGFHFAVVRRREKRSASRRSPGVRTRNR